MLLLCWKKNKPKYITSDIKISDEKNYELENSDEENYNEKHWDEENCIEEKNWHCDRVFFKRTTLRMSFWEGYFKNVFLREQF